MQMLSRQERRLVGRGQASSSRNMPVMIHMGTRSSDKRPNTTAAARLGRGAGETRASPVCLACPDVGHGAYAMDAEAVITQLQGAVHLPQAPPGYHC